MQGPLHDHVTTTYGLQDDSILNSSKFFHVTEGLVPDIMHDILEGSLQYEVKELLKHFIYTENFFSLDQLNKKINEFPYILSDEATRPSMIAPNVLASADHSVNQKGWFIHTGIQCMQTILIYFDNIQLLKCGVWQGYYL